MILSPPEPIVGLQQFLVRVSWNALQEQGSFVLQSAGKLAIYSFISNNSQDYRIICRLGELGEFVVARGDELIEMISELSWFAEYVEAYLPAVSSASDLEVLIKGCLGEEEEEAEEVEVQEEEEEEKMEKEDVEELPKKRPKTRQSDQNIASALQKGVHLNSSNPALSSSSSVEQRTSGEVREEKRRQRKEDAIEEDEKWKKQVNSETDPWNLRKLMKKLEEDKSISSSRQALLRSQIDQRFSILFWDWIEKAALSQLYDKRTQLLRSGEKEEESEIAFSRQALILIENQLVNREISAIQRNNDIRSLWQQRRAIMSSSPLFPASPELAWKKEKLTPHLNVRIWEVLVSLGDSEKVIEELYSLMKCGESGEDEFEKNLRIFVERMLDYCKLNQQAQKQQETQQLQSQEKEHKTQGIPVLVSPPPRPPPPPLPPIPTFTPLPTTPSSSNTPTSLSESLLHLFAQRKNEGGGGSKSIVTTPLVPAKAKLIKLTENDTQHSSDSDDEKEVEEEAEWGMKNSSETGRRGKDGSLLGLVKERCPPDWLPFVGIFGSSEAEGIDKRRYAFMITISGSDVGRLVVSVPSALLVSQKDADTKEVPFSILHLSCWKKTDMASVAQCALNQLCFLKQVFLEQTSGSYVSISVEFQMCSTSSCSVQPPSDLLEQLRMVSLVPSCPENPCLLTTKVQQPPRQISQFERMVYHPRFAW